MGDNASATTPRPKGLFRRLTTHRESQAPPASTTSPPSKRPLSSSSQPSYQPLRPTTNTAAAASGATERPPAISSHAQKLIAPSLVVQQATPPPCKAAVAPPPPPSAPTASKAPSLQLEADRKVTFSTPDRQQITNPTSKPSTTAGTYTTEAPSQHKPAAAMSRRKVWIKRPGASATIVQIQHDDVVDEVRDLVLRKYANSLGRTFDSPDVTIKIIPRERSQQVSERLLAPEEPICHILDAYFPGGQNVDEALLVDVSARRTPKPSPRIVNHMTSYFEDARPVENEGDYFPPQLPALSPNHVMPTMAAGDRRPSITQFPHSMAILETGRLPALPFPSPGIRPHNNRPRYARQHTSSPSIASTGSKSGNISNLHHPGERARPQQRSIVDVAHAPTPPPLPTPPVIDTVQKAMSTKAATPPLDRIASPRPSKKETRGRGDSVTRPAVDAGGRKVSDKQPTYSFLEGIVPPINVLIVEDNPINLRLLEMFAKRLKVRWSTAMNGRDAVIRWRSGGFHLVLMDIQLPIMSGLEATKEIRRLERVNGIGVFARSEGEERVGMAKVKSSDGPVENGLGLVAAESTTGAPVGDDKLDGIFKSPVIIVALTASSLQSDRHEALAAGCNDFLTKPVSFVWLERKVMEWGCMQALIDFDGWRKWKDMAALADEQQAIAQANEDPATKAKREKREEKQAKKAALMAKMASKA